MAQLTKIKDENVYIPSTACVLAGIASFLFAGLGQLLFGRLGSAAAFIIVEAVLWLEFLSGFSYIGFNSEFLFFSLFALRLCSAYLISNVEAQNFVLVENYEQYLDACKVHGIKPKTRKQYESNHS